MVRWVTGILLRGLWTCGSLIHCRSQMRAEAQVATGPAQLGFELAQVRAELGLADDGGAKVVDEFRPAIWPVPCGFSVP